jgi:glutamate-1-semialdehyde aminotransferase
MTAATATVTVDFTWNGATYQMDAMAPLAQVLMSTRSTYDYLDSQIAGRLASLTRAAETATADLAAGRSMTTVDVGMLNDEITRRQDTAQHITKLLWAALQTGVVAAV